LAFVQDSFFNFQSDLFEYQLTNTYFRYSLTLFPSDNDFVGWLIDFYRKYIKNKPNSDLILSTEYFVQQNNTIYQEEGEKLFCLLQFLNFIKKLDYSKTSEYFTLKAKKYFSEEFYLANFMKFIQIPSTNSDRCRKLIDYFKILHKVDPIVQELADGRFRIYATFLFSDVDKRNGRHVVNVIIIEDLYNYSYPFMISNHFLNFKNQTDCLLKLYILRSISVQSIEKIFPVSEFLLRIKLSNSKLVQVKKDFIKLIQEIAQEEIIQDKIKIIPKKKRISVKLLTLDELQIQHLNQKIIYLIFYELIE